MKLQDLLSGAPGAAPAASTRLGAARVADALGRPRQSAGEAGALAHSADGLSFSRQLAALRPTEPPFTLPTEHPSPAGAVLQATAAPTPSPSMAAAEVAPPSPLFSAAQPSADVTVRRGDTLTSLVRARWASTGGAREALSANEAHRWALQVARDNGLADADRIQVGQRLALGPPLAAVASAVTKPAATPTATPMATPMAMPAPIMRVDAVGPTGRLLSSVLAQTLDRAVGRGYISTAERGPVGERIEALAGKHGFKPDDFAKAVLMESDGLNPKASNGRCHGIIQFCSGPDRGAASAGYGQRPQEILKLSVLQQLDLVDRYFDDTKLRDFRGRDGQVRLDDLYLTILTPAARQERSLSAALPIAGPQALDLHVRRERQSPITRSSILAGLNVNAKARLGQFMVADLMAR